jgi:tetratricopeptide (TPR) repeat protein
MKAKLGADDSTTLNTLINMADAYEAQGQPAKVELLVREAQAIRRNQAPVEIRADEGPRLGRRGELYGRGGQWLKAAANYAAALKADPQDHMLWFRSAPIWLQLGDRQAYRHHCQEMLRGFRETNDPVVAHRTAKACLLSPDAGADLTLVSRLAERAVTGTETHDLYGSFLVTRSLAHLRAGEFHRAIALVSHAPGGLYLDVHADLVLAMAHHRMGRADEAAKALGKARALMEQSRFPRMESDDLGANFHDWLICQLLRREAEALIGPLNP